MSRSPTRPIATAFTVPVWPVNAAPMGRPVAASQTRTVVSRLPERRPAAERVGRTSCARYASRDRRRGIRPIPQPAPRQGFESEAQRGSRSLQPPGAADLVVSAAELVTELAKAGLSRGERLVRDLVSRRP